MKIHKKGNPKRRQPSWIGHRNICHSCGCEFTLEVGDEDKVKGYDQPHGGFYPPTWTDCPECGSRIGLPSPYSM